MYGHLSRCIYSINILSTWTDKDREKQRGWVFWKKSSWILFGSVLSANEGHWRIWSATCLKSKRFLIPPSPIFCDNDSNNTQLKQRGPKSSQIWISLGNMQDLVPLSPSWHPQSNSYKRLHRKCTLPLPPPAWRHPNSSNQSLFGRKTSSELRWKRRNQWPFYWKVFSITLIKTQKVPEIHKPVKSYRANRGKITRLTKRKCECLKPNSQNYGASLTFFCHWNNQRNFLIFEMMCTPLVFNVLYPVDFGQKVLNAWCKNCALPIKNCCDTAEHSFMEHHQLTLGLSSVRKCSIWQKQLSVNVAMHKSMPFQKQEYLRQRQRGWVKFRGLKVQPGCATRLWVEGGLS